MIGESIAVGVQRTKVKCTDNLTHVSLQRVFQLVGNFRRRHVQEVLGSQTGSLWVRSNTNLCHGIHVDIDEIVGRNTLLGLDIHRDLSEIDLVKTFKERDTNTTRSDEHTRLAANTRYDVSIRGRRLDIGNENEHYENRHNGKDNS